MERSQKQIDASRANGARSRGPVTAAGKRTCAQNARKHGAYTLSAIPDAELASFPQFLAIYTEQYAPLSADDHHAVRQLAAATARIVELDAIKHHLWETRIQSNPGLTLGETFQTLVRDCPALAYVEQLRVGANRRLFAAVERLQPRKLTKTKKSGNRPKPLTAAQPETQKSLETNPSPKDEGPVPPREDRP